MRMRRGRGGKTRFPRWLQGPGGESPNSLCWGKCRVHFDVIKGSSNSDLPWPILPLMFQAWRQAVGRAHKCTVRIGAHELETKPANDSYTSHPDSKPKVEAPALGETGIHSSTTTLITLHGANMHCTDFVPRNSITHLEPRKPNSTSSPRRPNSRARQPASIKSPETRRLPLGHIVGKGK